MGSTIDAPKKRDATQSWAEASDAELASWANRGDRRAADEFLRRNWRSMRSTARYVAGRIYDADDLLAGALSSTWEKWTTGQGPDQNVPGYIAQSMRNRVRDEVRSPRSKVVSLDEELSMLSAVDEHSRIDMSIEFAALREALASLPVDQQTLLIEAVVHGRRPRELEGDLSRSAEAISTGLHRAKKRLRAALLRQLLRDACDDRGCVSLQERVAAESQSHPRWDDSSPTLARLWRCAKCASGLRAYESLSTRSM